MQNQASEPLIQKVALEFIEIIVRFAQTVTSPAGESSNQFVAWKEWRRLPKGWVLKWLKISLRGSNYNEVFETEAKVGVKRHQPEISWYFGVVNNMILLTKPWHGKYRKKQKTKLSKTKMSKILPPERVQFTKGLFFFLLWIWHHSSLARVIKSYSS